MMSRAGRRELPRLKRTISNTPALSNPRSRFRRHSVLVAVVILAVAGAVLAAARIAMPRVAIARFALVTARLASAINPDRRRQQLDDLHRFRRIVAGDDQFGRPRISFGRLVANHQPQTRPRVQCRGERTVDQLSVLVL